MSSVRKFNVRMASEMLLLFGGMPLLVMLVRERFFMVAVLWGSALALFGLVSKKEGFSFAGEWNLAEVGKGLPQVLFHFTVATPLLVAFSMVYEPESFFAFPRDHTGAWVAVMLLYPLLSVLPQEIIYRSFFFHRYEEWLGNTWMVLAVSAFSFGYMHAIFGNYVAIILSWFGGMIISRTYAQHRSLALACLEHSLYGCLVFTIGLGRYFFSGAVWG